MKCPIKGMTFDKVCGKIAMCSRGFVYNTTKTCVMLFGVSSVRERNFWPDGAPDIRCYWEKALLMRENGGLLNRP